MDPFVSLTPERIWSAMESQGFRPTGALRPLNSYENRVYEIGLEEAEPVVVKFYRPGRWRQEALIEEHQFLMAAGEAECPVVLPLALKYPIKEIKTLGLNENFYYALYPKFRGREHDEITNEDRLWLGRSLARLHNVGEHFKTSHRLQLTRETYGDASLEFILSQPFLPSDLKKNIEQNLLMALQRITPFFSYNFQNIVLHGDCHPGNILWNKAGPHLLDFDDMLSAPPVQDLWMLFYGDQTEVAKQQECFFAGYNTFRDFDGNSFILTEPLRTLRMIRHAAWIGQRYAEQAFKNAFPYYEQRRYWETFLLEIKEQIALLQEVY